MYEYRAKIVSIYDADTIRMDIDCGFNIWKKNESIRLARIDALEVRGEERPYGLEARDYVRGLLPTGTEVIIKTEKDKKGKYGRYIAEVLLYDMDEKTALNLNDHLVEKDFAVYKEY